jgi:fructokinase
MIVCCGENLIDMVPAVPPRGAAVPHNAIFSAVPGGCPYNSAIAASRLGAEVEFLGATSSDFLGDRLFERLTANGVGTSLLSRIDSPATLAFVEKNEKGEARYAFYRNGTADMGYSVADLPPFLPAEAHFLLAGSISLALPPIADAVAALIRREGRRLLVSLDPNIRASLIPDRESHIAHIEALLESCAIFKASDEDLAWMYGDRPIGELVSHILSLGPEIVFVTRGKEGAFAATKKSRAAVKAFDLQVVDTIGAGDTFHAALLVAFEMRTVRTREALAALDSESLHSILRFAAAAAAITCTREGADPPRLEELLRCYPDCPPRDAAVSSHND